MKKFLFLISFFFAISCTAQKSKWTKLIINPHLKIDTSFNKNWDYSWYIVKHEDGHFENTISDSITSDDTAHQYYTAACTNTHSGYHQINYCKAALYNDDVELHFSGSPPGYNEDMMIVIRNNYFKGEYNFSYIMMKESVDITYQIVSQKLVLKSKPVYDSILTGYIYLQFREKLKYRKPTSAKKTIVKYSKIYFLKGRFHTKLDSVIESE